MVMLHGIDIFLLIIPLAYFFIVGGLLDGYIVYVVLKLKRFAGAFWQALFANIISLLAGFLAWPYIFPTGFDFADFSMGSYFLLWLVTMLTEALILKVFHYQRNWSGIFAASVLMNTISFIILYLYFLMIN